MMHRGALLILVISELMKAGRDADKFHLSRYIPATLARCNIAKNAY